MTETNPELTEYIQTLIDTFAQQHLTQIVLSPGSRSTPVALLLAHNAKRCGFQIYVDVDERSAGFFALGLTKTNHEPTLLVCTSGTAAANYFPAIIEAHHTHQPLIVLTTDRPPELTNNGAPQAIDQDHLYGRQVKDFLQLPLPDNAPQTLHFLNFSVQRAILTARTLPKGPVQLNLPLRKPLMPDLLPIKPLNLPIALEAPESITGLTADALENLVNALSEKKVLVLAGPAEDHIEQAPLLDLARKAHWPILADALSQFRQTQDPLVITCGDALFKSGLSLGTAEPEIVLRFGATPVSANIAKWLSEFDGPIYYIDPNKSLADHTLSVTMPLQVDPNTLFKQLLEDIIQAPSAFLKTWHHLEQHYVHFLADFLGENTLSEMQIPYLLGHVLTSGVIFSSNSMPIRDFETAYLPQTQLNYLYGNRGANGIDGVISTALGVACAAKEPAYLVIGDLAFFHDMNGLMMAVRHHLNLTILIMNNNGGGIFSFLPQAKAQTYFEPLFGTPQNLDFAAVSKLYQGTYAQPKNAAELQDLLDQPNKGLRLIEIRTSRSENLAQHRRFEGAIRAQLEAALEN